MQIIYTDFDGNTQRICNVRVAHLSTPKGDIREDPNISIIDNANGSIEMYNLRGLVSRETKISLRGF
jgi:hypothetical protein